MKLDILIFAALGIASVSSTYIVTCHNDQECGTVCGNYGPDTIAPSEGLFGTTCSCQNRQQPSYLCNRDGKNVYVCSDNQPPRCSVACGQQVCIQKDGRQSTGVIRSACPRYHPQNAHDCCNYGGSYCTCVFDDTIDSNWKVYNELGGNNGYSSNAYWGACGSHLGLKVGSVQGSLYFNLVRPKMCSAVMSDGYHQRVNHDMDQSLQTLQQQGLVLSI
ncbi:UNKNOWN [Stylonychia lemnae]|uniref:Uncharacterized protein n=1 Tax=Stylonychia lemnae TaxID=5949 RepID=A0A077ZSV6_STYLE|nr:UNKNOWN [Stylonychia lemnae]|eukprot:CDW72395.1 UNKNOWN [Stylonychia lemnae]